MTRSALIGFLLLALLGAPQPARAHDDAAPPKRLGTVAFANSCAPDAQESFERGVALLHSFAFIAGEQAFREALAHDPACAIATWGIATVLVGNTFAIGPIAEEAQRAFAAIERGRAIGAETERERDYIEAIGGLLRHFGERPPRARMQSLADAFEAWRNRYGDDDEAQIFSALYLAATQSPADKTYGAGREGGGNPRGAIREASRSSGRRPLSHPQLRLSADRAKRPAGGAVLRRYRARRPARAAHAVAHLHPRRRLAGIDRDQCALRRVGDGGRAI